MSDALIWGAAANKKELERFKDFVTIAYMLACWHHTDPKKLPSLADVLKDFDEKPAKAKPQSAEDMLNVVKMLNAKFGGGVGGS